MVHWGGEEKKDLVPAGFVKTEREQENGAPQPLTQQAPTLKITALKLENKSNSPDVWMLLKGLLLHRVLGR